MAYFAKPYSSSVRERNENLNGLLRQCFPKVMELVEGIMKRVFEAIDKLNNRSIKCFNFKTSYEVFEVLAGGNVKKEGVFHLSLEFRPDCKRLYTIKKYGAICRSYNMANRYLITTESQLHYLVTFWNSCCQLS
jgi:hypothetical protein